MRKLFVVALLAALGLLVPLSAGAADRDSTEQTYVVLYAKGASPERAKAAIEAGVAALLVASRGRHDFRNGGLRLSPDVVERVLNRTAQNQPCPTPRTFTYPDPDLGPEYTAFCEGTRDFNGFYGEGIVDAFAASKTHRYSH